MAAPARTGRAALALLCAADLLVMIDGMVVAVALPSIGRDLGFSAAGLQWVVTAYTLTLGSFLLGLSALETGLAFLPLAVSTVAAAGGFPPAYLAAAGLAVLGSAACLALR